MRLLAVLALLLPLQARAEAVPVFNPTGPDAAAYGQAEGYLVHNIGPDREQRYLVGAFSHQEQLLPFHPVAKSATPAPLARAAKELAMHYRYQGRVYSLAEYLDRNPTTGLLILRDRSILFEHYQYARTDTDHFTSHSMAKTVTSMLVGIAVSEGKIKSIDDLAQIYVPELAGSEIGATSIRALLHMASGIAFRETYDGHDDAAALSRALWARNSQGPAAAIRQFNTREAAPDTQWLYKGVDTEALGLVLTRAVRMSQADYLAARIWSRIGTEADASWNTDAKGQEAAFCCLNATLRDWARLGDLLANDGAFNGQQIIPAAWVRAATTPSAPFLQPGTSAGYFGYGYQVWLFPGERRQFALQGVHGQSIFVDPPTKTVLVHTAVRRKPSRDPTTAELIALWQALIAQSGG